ncbi:MAG: aldehyde dehydrogenase, partial [Acetobacteraceae bacterium]|nr:aldehyde dehydrogenase [Acetobacteraceae bacterium]
MTSELDRRAVVAALLKEPGELLVVAGLGTATYDVGAVAERSLNFYLWGAMGGAAMV